MSLDVGDYTPEALRGLSNYQLEQELGAQAVMCRMISGEGAIFQSIEREKLSNLRAEVARRAGKCE